MKNYLISLLFSISCITFAAYGMDDLPDFATFAQDCDNSLAALFAKAAPMDKASDMSAASRDLIIPDQKNETFNLLWLPNELIEVIFELFMDKTNLMPTIIRNSNTLRLLCKKANALALNSLFNIISERHNSSDVPNKAFMAVYLKSFNLLKHVKSIEELEISKSGKKKNRAGYTPLIKAIKIGDPKFVENLLDKGCEINELTECNVIFPGDDQFSKEEVSPLMISAIYADSQMFELLIKKGANRDLKNSKGETAFDYANKSFEKCKCFAYTIWGGKNWNAELISILKLLENK